MRECDNCGRTTKSPKTCLQCAEAYRLGAEAQRALMETQRRGVRVEVFVRGAFWLIVGLFMGTALGAWASS